MKVSTSLLSAKIILFWREMELLVPTKKLLFSQGATSKLLNHRCILLSFRSIERTHTFGLDVTPIVGRIDGSIPV